VTVLRSVPTALRRAFLLGLLGLALTVPHSAPDGTGMQWDELVLGSVAVTCAWTVWRRVRTMERTAARPWYPVTVGAALFAVTQFLLGAFPGPELDGFGIDDVVLLVGATSPLATCAMLAHKVSRTRWAALAVDGLVVTTALIVLTEVLRTPLVNPVGAPDDLRSLVLLYGVYAAVMLGFAGATCTVSTAALRPAATALIGAVTLQSTAAAAEAMAIVSPSPGWTAVSDVAVASALLAAAFAAHRAPLHLDERGARASAPVVSPLGLVLVVGAMLSLPVAIIHMEIRDTGHSLLADVGMAVVFALMALRLVLRIREDGQVSEVLVRSEEDFRELVESSSDGVAIVDADARLRFTSPAARRLLGITDPDAEVSLLDLVVPEDRALLRAATQHGPSDGPPLHVHVPAGEDGLRELEVTSTERFAGTRRGPRAGTGGERRVVHLRDVTTRRRRERELERMAYTDHLTELPNRALLFQEMGRPSADGRCLLVLDLDGFKAVNDEAGHEAGDQLLVEVARRLHTVVRDDDLVARLGGDEFAVLVTGTLDEAEEVAQRVVDVLGMPHRTSGHTFAVGASVGVAGLGAAGGQAAFREADGALRAAKQAGKGCVRVSGRVLSTGVEAQPDFHDVVAEGEFTVRMDSACAPDGRIELVHVVPAWTHPVHGTVRGTELWGFAERQGRTAELQTWLLHETCRLPAALDDAGIDVAVSLPAGQVVADGLAATVAEALAAAGLDPHRLVLSFTEETLLTSSAALLPELEVIRRSGVRLCLDNYGMGHSLFALLARIPLDVVRVDLNALAGRDDSARALQVLTAIVRTTDEFDLAVVAGGIGTEQLRGSAVDAGVTLLHGRALPHDLSAGELAALLAAVPTP
jgi:diguanylate cyclase (GGDEF)-like protein/PAS domain S-box-containing protein